MIAATHSPEPSPRIDASFGVSVAQPVASLLGKLTNATTHPRPTTITSGTRCAIVSTSTPPGNHCQKIGPVTVYLKSGGEDRDAYWATYLPPKLDLGPEIELPLGVSVSSAVLKCCVPILEPGRVPDTYPCVVNDGRRLILWEQREADTRATPHPTDVTGAHVLGDWRPGRFAIFWADVEPCEPVAFTRQIRSGRTAFRLTR